MHSFLDESRNTELIRWSESGDSFIVVDEDEFAKTLIPELFKHNNYASFVRQLNMYGFHKKVGLSDNSMRASERKNKSPSEYYNPYFKRGRPNLLWLIQKPKNPQGKGGGKGGTRIKQEDGNLDDDGDDMFDGDTPTTPNYGSIESSPNLRNGRQPLMIGQGGGGLPRDELANVQRELQAVRQQQQLISSVLQQTREQHKQLYGQAAAFQSLHDRHESSINAILTFLATVYNRSLEEQGGPNFASMFAGAIPHDTQGQGNVVDVGDFGDQDPNTNGQQPRRFRKQPLLLKAPPNSQNGKVSASSPSSAVESPFQRPQSHLSPGQTPNYPYNVRNPAHSPAIQELSEGQTPSNRSSQSPQVIADNELNEHIPEADIMSMINSTNASAGPFSTESARMDFPEALSHLQSADGKSPLTPNQRQDVLQLMANESASTRPNGNNNALAFPSPPAVLDMSPYNLSKEQIEFLGNSLKEQEHKVNELSNILAPLSPSGSIPGIGSDPPNYNGSEMLDLDQIFNSGDYFNDAATTGDLNFGTGNDLADFTFDTSTPENSSIAGAGGGGGVGGSGGGGGGAFKGGYDGRTTDGQDRVAETLISSVSTSPAVTVEDEFPGDETRSPGRKRRKG